MEAVARKVHRDVLKVYPKDVKEEIPFGDSSTLPPLQTVLLRNIQFIVQI
jgi:hypothetical protein